MTNSIVHESPSATSSLNNNLLGQSSTMGFMGRTFFLAHIQVISTTRFYISTCRQRFLFGKFLQKCVFGIVNAFNSEQTTTSSDGSDQD